MITVTAAGETVSVTTDQPPLMLGATYPGKNLGPWTALHYYIQQSGSYPAPSSALFAYTYSDFLRSAPGTPPSGVGWSTVPSIVSAVRANLATLPDIPGLWVNDYHEPEDNYGRTPAGAAKYNADAVVFGQQVASVNQSRTNPLTWFQQFMGGSIVGQNNLQTMLPWIVPTVDAVGWDVYGPNQVDAAVNFGRLVGKPICIPEMGPLNNVDHTDPAILSYMQTAVPKFRAGGVLWVTWFNKIGSGGDLNQYPNSLAYWRSQI
jgi:hypothetical protein